MEFIAGAVTEAKIKYDDPSILVMGDYNQWNVQDYLQDFPDLSEVNVGPTREDRQIDRVFCNLVGVEEAGTVPPLRQTGMKQKTW